VKTYTYPPDIEAEITFVPTEQGGRKTLAFSNYCPQFHYDGLDCGAYQEYPDVESVAPGQTVRALLRFIFPDKVCEVIRFHAGMEFQVREGSRVVAHGRVTKILHLAESAERRRKMNLQIHNEEHEQFLRGKVVAVARSILAGEVGIVAGARQFVRATHRVGVGSDQDFRFFIGVDSETDHLPLGEVRQRWNPDALLAKDAELADYEARVRERAFAACRSLIQKYDHDA
jgi:Elongation factor Tu C-terminal domain